MSSRHARHEAGKDSRRERGIQAVPVVRLLKKRLFGVISAVLQLSFDPPRHNLTGEVQYFLVEGRNMKFSRKCVLVLASACLTSTAFAAVTARDFGRAIDQVFQGSGVVHIDAATYNTGFEPAQGFAVGPIEPQQGWSATGTNLPFASVTTANPFAGTQNLRLVRDNTTSPPNESFAVSPDLGPQVPAAQTNTMMVDISNDGGADYLIAGQSLSQSAVTWQVVFFFEGATSGSPGTILVADDIGSGLEFVDTGVAWDQGVYRQLRVDTDPVANTIDYFYNGAHIYSSVSGMWGGTVTEQMVFDDDNFQLNGETADFDNVGINNVPEPAGLGLLVLLAACGVRRR